MRLGKRTYLLFVLGVLLALALPACGGSEGEGSTPSEEVVRVGEPAPDFELSSVQHGQVSMAEFRGRKPVLLYFSMGPG